MTDNILSYQQASNGRCNWCCLFLNNTSVLNTQDMGAGDIEKICEGILEKKVDRRLFQIGASWKRKYCVLSTDAFRWYRNKTKTSPLRTLPLCHIHSVSNVKHERVTDHSFFVVETERGETLTFRSKGNTKWVAQIQIQLIHYKNRQDILRYKYINNSIDTAEKVVYRLQAKTKRSESCRNENHYVSEKQRLAKGCRVVELPNNRSSGIGIGITVVPHSNGSVVVNRVLDGGPAILLGTIKPRDEIVSANGKRVTSVAMLSDVVRNSQTTVSLVLRTIPRSPSIDDDPKSLLKSFEQSPDYINIESDFEKISMLKQEGVKTSNKPIESPRHFKFT